MNADRSSSRADLLEAGLTEKIIGAFYAVYNDLGFGRLEAVCLNALRVELSYRGIAWEKEVLYPVHYRGVQVGPYRCDLLVDRRVIVELKATHRLTDADRRQLLNYLRSADVEVGLLLHFGPGAAFERVVASRSHFAPRSDPRHPRDPR
ncbi:MAG TPA: GxxExxY protein [Solirubrobacterales bacterium]|nr:GxxExxY protein [Solirubrobacterales bacterium]